MTWPIAVNALGPVAVGSLLWRRRGKIRISAVVKATFSLIHGGFALPTQARAIQRQERAWLGRNGGSPEIAPEVWPELRRPEVFLTGTAMTPNREPCRALAVRLVVWKNHSRLDKTLHVFGDRAEADRAPTPFSTQPLVWERATRGVNGTNPVGVNGRPAGIVDPRRPDEPAGFGPRSVNWPGRDLGHHLVAPLPTAGPWDWPETVSPEAFGAAPADQRLDALDGDEWLLMDGMHAELPRFASRLPKPVASASLRDEAGRREAFSLSLDTVAIDMLALEVSLLFRGSLPLLREHYADLVIEADLDLGDADPLRPVGATDPSARIAAGLGKGMRLGDAADSVTPRSVMPTTSPPVPKEPVVPPLVAPAAASTALSQAAIVTPPSLAHLGMNALGVRPGPPALGAAIADDVTPAVPDSPAAHQPSAAPFPLSGSLARAPAAADPAPASAAAADPAPTSAAAADPASTIAAPADPASASPPPLQTAPLTRGPELEAPVESGIRATLIAKIASKLPLNDLALAGADLSSLDLSGALLSGLNLAGAKLCATILRGARLSNAKLPGVDLTAADLTGADLTQADLSRSTLTGTCFEEATLLDANLTSAEGKGARFDRCHAQRALFAQGKWSNASFIAADLAGADLSGSELHGGHLERAVLTGARLVDVRATGLDAPSVELADANLAGVTFTDGNFAKAQAARTVWDRAVLDGTSFRGATLDSAGFARAHMDRTDFSEASLIKASLMGVSGEGALFVSANLDSVDLRQGKLPDAKLDQAKLCKVNALKATLSQASLNGADLTGASLRSAKMRGASLNKAVLRDCDLRDADLEAADLRGADKQGAKLAGATLKGAQEGE